MVLGARYLFFEREMVARLLGVVNLKTILILGSDDDGSAAYAMSFDWPHASSPVLQEEGKDQCGKWQPCHQG
jgi:hypothetical protein